jgi:Glycosyl hydrolase family 71
MKAAVTRVTLALALVLGAVVTAAGGPTVTVMTPVADTLAAPAGSAVPLLAYYYLWFDPASWDRAKKDYPLLGRYSSDDPRVMRQHIAWAKSAGIEGFIVSWKDTPTNDRRLRLLMTVARETNFKLAMIYQGLDFDRKPQPVGRVARDFATFREQFAPDPVFVRIGGKPLTMWSGTWAFSHSDIATVTGPVRSAMLVLATERSVDGYERVADVTDGDAYYWSSVNPATNTYYAGKLTAMSNAIHADGKYWMAPLAPGFDARLVAGTTEVSRNDGETLRVEYATALNSSPDLLGLISWNEFSENSYVEPSQRYASRYLDVLREVRHTVPPVPPSAVESSDASGQALAVYWSNALVLFGFPVVLAAVVFVTARVRRRRGKRTVA